VATIQKIKRSKDTAYRVLIRQAGINAISKTFSTKKEAVKFAYETETDRVKLSKLSNAKFDTTIAQVIKQYLLTEYKGSRPKEQAQKLQYWCKHFGNKRASEITAADIDKGIGALPKHLKNATINRYVAAISVVLNYACRYYDLSNNPVRHISPLPEKNSRTRFLSNSEKTRLLGACMSSNWDKLHLLVLLAITTGARKGELTKLRWSDIDFDRQTAFVRTSKNGQPKVLPLTDSVIKELQLFNTKDNSLIFASTVKPDKPYCFTKPWYKALKDADIEDFRFHDLRHSCASYLAMNGASLLEIADVLGHKQIQMTKRYAHLCIEHKSSLINRVMGGI